MATKPITPEDLIAAAKRLRRRGMKRVSIKASEYLMTEIDRLGKDIGAVVDTYFTLGSRLNKGYKESYGTDYTSNEGLKKVAFDLMGAKDALGDVRDDLNAGKSLSVKDIENAADKEEERMRDLIFGLQNDLNDIFKLAAKVGNRDVMNAIEILNGLGKDDGN